MHRETPFHSILNTQLLFNTSAFPFWTHILLFVTRVTQTFSLSLWSIFWWCRLRLECGCIHWFASLTYFRSRLLRGRFLLLALPMSKFYFCDSLLHVFSFMLFYSQCTNQSPSIDHSPSKVTLGQCGLLYGSLFRGIPLFRSIEFVLYSKLD